MILSDTAINRPVTTTLFTLVLVFFGYMGYRSMGVDLFPEVEFPVVTVMAALPGADPEIMDQNVADVLEEQIATIAGLKSLRSTSNEGRVMVVAEFVLSKNVDVAAQEVRDKINLAQRLLPEDMDPPIVDKVDIAAQPIMWVALTTAGDYRRMALYADNIVKERLQSLPGVGSIFLGGFRDREVRVWLDPFKLEARGLTARDVATAIRAKHIELPGGRIEQPDKEFVVKVKGEYTSVDELGDLVVFEEEGALVRLRDVARVVDGSEDLRSVARFNGMPTIGLGIRKQSGTNTVEVADNVRRELDKLKTSLPEGIELSIATDNSRFIRNSMHDVLFDLFLGVILTAAVMYFFLRNVRMTLISLTAIPVSLITSFMVMNALGFTINNMTMLAMGLAVGIVIDDAIVVLENIFRHVEEGETPYEASRVGASEVALAVIAASSSIMAVFLPVALMQGIIGRFFFQFGFTVALSVLVSLITAFTVVPMLCSRFLRYEPKHGRIFTALEHFFEGMENTYSTWLDRALRHRWITLAAGMAFFIGGLMLVPFVDKAFVTTPDESRFLTRFQLPTGASLDKTNATLREIEKMYFEQPEIRSAFAAVGMMGDVNSGILFTNLIFPGERDASQADVIARLRNLARERLPDVMISLEPISPVGGGQRNAEIMFTVQGPSVERIGEVSEAIMAEMRQIKGIVDVDNDLRLDKPEVSVDIDRNMADNLGVDVSSIADNFNILFGGQDVAFYKEGGNRYDIRLRADPDMRLRPEDIYNVAVRSSRGELIRSPNLVQVEEGVGPNAINRYQRMRAVTIFANLEGLALGEALEQVQAIAAKHLPDEPGWATALTGQAETFQEAFGFLVIAIITAMVLIYVILGSQFESFIHPFTILMSVPLAVIGGIGGLLLTRMTLDIFSFIGFVMLIGLVTKNSILLVEFTIQLRERGMSRDEALRKAGPIRLRPILMTALTVLAAMLPIAMSLSEGGEQRAPMGVAVFGGMLTSTFLTLLVIPCVYTVMDDFSNYLVRTFGVKNVAAQTAHIPTPQESSSS